MKLLPEQYRHFEKHSLVWKEVTPETFEPEAAQREFEEKFFAKKGPELANLNPAEVAQEVGAYFEENFSPKQYEAEIRVYLQERGQSEDTVNRSVVDSVSRYTKVYETERAAFYRNIEARISDSEDLMEEAVGKIKDKTKVELELLNGMIQNVRGTEAATPQIGEVSPPVKKEVLGGTWSYQIPIVGPIFKNVDLPILTPIISNRDYLAHKEFSAKTKEAFLKQFLPALGAQYFNLPWQEQNLSEKDFSDYGDLSEEFQDGMADHLEGQLDFIFQNSPDAETLRTRLEGLRDETVERYKRYAKNEGLIDLAGLKELKRQAGAYVDLARVVNSGGSEDEIVQKIEGMNFFGRDSWAEASSVWADEMVETIRANGTDQAFIETIKKQSGKTEEMTFDQAATVFKKMVAERAQVGIRETIQLAREVNTAANGRHAEILKLEEGIPDSIRPMVETERKKLIDRITIPKNVDDRLLVDFVRQEREGRDRTLSNSTERLALFQAVKNVLAREQDQGWGQKIRALPKKTSELTTDRRPEKPTGHDEIARYLALIAMAKEAQATIESLDKAKEYQGQNLLAAYEGIEAEKKLPNVDMRFRDINRLYSTRYVSEASRAGFNGRSIGLGLLTVWLGATALVNARKAGLKGLHKNPFFLASAAGLYGMKKYHDNPEFKNYFSENAGGQERIVEQTALNSLARKVGRDRLTAFISDGDEFAALESLMKEDPKAAIAKIKDVREKAKKRYGPLPIVTKDDLKGVMEDRVQTQLAESQDKTRERTRYLFYEAFLSNPRNVRELRDNCQKWLAK
jgi:hypothetical protein